MSAAIISGLIDSTRIDGGATVSMNEATVPLTGYMVGGLVDSLIFDASLITDNSPGHRALVHAKITEWLNGHQKLTSQPWVFVGGWIDTKENVAYIDLSDHVDVRRNAIQLAIGRNELAIWDLANESEIVIP